MTLRAKIAWGENPPSANKSEKSKNRYTETSAQMYEIKSPLKADEDKKGKNRIKQQQKNASKQEIKHKRHIILLKMCFSVTFVYFLTYAILMCAAFTGDANFFITYLQYFNHIGNPATYYIFSPKFREDSKKIIVKLKSILCL